MKAPVGAAGFSLVELLVGSGLAMAVAAGAFALIVSAQAAFLTQPEAADIRQRLRVGADALTRDLVGADLVLPYRIGERGSDAALGRYFRDDAISILSSVAPNTGSAVVHVYSLRTDETGDTYQLMHYDGHQGEFPVLDHIVLLAFEYFGADGAAAIDPAVLTNGPWLPDAADPGRFDADVLGIRRVRIRMRAQAPRPFRGPAGVLFTHGGSAAAPARHVPDRELTFDVALRNRDPGHAAP